jgi:hypothetical protein
MKVLSQAAFVLMVVSFPHSGRAQSQGVLEELLNEVKQLRSELRALRAEVPRGQRLLQIDGRGLVSEACQPDQSAGATCASRARELAHSECMTYGFRDGFPSAATILLPNPPGTPGPLTVTAVTCATE